MEDVIARSSRLVVVLPTKLSAVFPCTLAGRSPRSGGADCEGAVTLSLGFSRPSTRPRGIPVAERDAESSLDDHPFSGPVRDF